MPQTTLSDQTLRDLRTRLKAQQEDFARHYPGESGTRQPVHTVYGGAHLFKSDTTRKLGDLALRALSQYAPNATTFAEAIGIDPGVAEIVYGRVQEKLKREAVEDFRIDFEDGYGIRGDDEEDGHAAQAAQDCAKGLKNGTLSPFIGIRIKSLSGELAARALRTLDIFLTNLGSKLPPNFLVTLPKITSPWQVSTLVSAFEALEPKLENARAVHAAWRLHADDVRHSLASGFYQGWDLHPAQLPSRYGTVYAFFLKSLPATSDRLKNFISKAAQATLHGDTFDDAATGQGLLNFFLRGVNCGALTEHEALATGLSIDELRGRSFLKILNNRKNSAQKA